MYKYHSTGQFKNTIKTVSERALYHSAALPTLEFEGTVKLDGTNSSVVCDYKKYPFITQSRNTVITPEQDNEGFSAFAHKPQVKAVLEKMFVAIREIASKNIDMTDKTAVIYGEWCGGGIKKGVALNGLPLMYVIFAVKISPTNETWEPSSYQVGNRDKDNSQISSSGDEETEEKLEEKTQDNSVYLKRAQIEEMFEKAYPRLEKISPLSIYSIYDFPTWRISVDMSQPRLAQNKLVEITQNIENECPVGAYFDKKGIGEGLVWRCTSDYSAFKTSDLFFKTKGEKHSVVRTKTIAQIDVEKVKSVYEFADKTATLNRLSQGLDYMAEMGLELHMKNMGAYLKWFANDCLKEEADTLLASGLEKKDVTAELNNRAKRFFNEQLQKQVEQTHTKASRPKM